MATEKTEEFPINMTPAEALFLLEHLQWPSDTVKQDLDRLKRDTPSHYGCFGATGAYTLSEAYHTEDRDEVVRALEVQTKMFDDLKAKLRPVAARYTPEQSETAATV